MTRTRTMTRPNPQKLARPFRFVLSPHASCTRRSLHDYSHLYFVTISLSLQVSVKKTEAESKYGALSSSSAVRQAFVSAKQAEAEEEWIKLKWASLQVSISASIYLHRPNLVYQLRPLVFCRCRSQSSTSEDVLETMFDVPNVKLECATRPLDFFSAQSIG
jgi:hypothetical protein